MTPHKAAGCAKLAEGEEGRTMVDRTIPCYVSIHILVCLRPADLAHPTTSRCADDVDRVAHESAGIFRFLRESSMNWSMVR
jgi:hypothetical protein